jgi:protein phosphatase
MILRAACASDPGQVRTNNEDCAYVGKRLLAVADGVGGLPAGEVASAIVIQALAVLDEVPETDDPLRALRMAVEAANQDIRDTAADDRAKEGMGTTVTAILHGQDRFGLLHVGDSRAYLFRDGALSQLTRDDTYVQVLVDQGVLTPEAARNHPQRSLVTRAVDGAHLAATCRIVDLRGGDRILLCSDGLSDFVTDAAIGTTLESYRDLDECAGQLVKLTLQAGAPDNVTVVVADLAD